METGNDLKLTEQISPQHTHTHKKSLTPAEMYLGI